LTEDPEFEAPVAKALIDRYSDRAKSQLASAPMNEFPLNPYQYQRRETNEVLNFGESNVPRVIADFSENGVQKMEDLKAVGHFYLPATDKWAMNDLGVDFIFSGNKPSTFMLPNGLKEILNYETWKTQDDQKNKFPLFDKSNLAEANINDQLKFLKVDASDLALIDFISKYKNLVLVLNSRNSHAMAEIRRFVIELISRGIKNPIVLHRAYGKLEESDFQLHAATDCGGLLIDGIGDGIMLSYEGLENKKSENSTAFGVLQAARTRITKTEYISCPSCGRTLFDLQETTAMIRKRTDHLKGVKIGIMGCIVNGPGEMADADYGYVGMGKDKIALYRGQTVIKRSVKAANAVDELIELIKEDGNWLEPATAEAVLS
jgi:(E)-4-hydroxy-3-methylbut-2-enyl-diphosphate synthase